MAHEAFLVGFQQLVHLKDARHFGPWIRVIAHNGAKRLGRKESRSQPVDGEQMDGLLNSDGCGPPTLQALVGLAPHIPKKDLAEMVEACLARDPVTDPHAIVGLAPHMDRQDLGRILHQNLPNWFDAKGHDARQPPEPPRPPAAPRAASAESAWQGSPERPEQFDR